EKQPTNAPNPSQIEWALDLLQTPTPENNGGTFTAKTALWAERDARRRAKLVLENIDGDNDDNYTNT
ncbi:MAG: hypothetical protein AAF413_04115, partial [Patescibacteria group bacterium]